MTAIELATRINTRHGVATKVITVRMVGTRAVGRWLRNVRKVLDANRKPRQN